jgi:hypothetical protein
LPASESQRSSSLETELPWLDRSNLRGGLHWLDLATTAILESRSFAFCVGPSGLGQWQKPELQIALSRHVNAVHEGGASPLPIIPVLLPGASADAIPAYLSGHTRIRFEKSLGEEEAFRRLVCSIRGIEPGLGSGEEGTRPECPYRGLQYFDVHHAPYFFGREASVERLISKLRNGHSAERSRAGSWRSWGLRGAVSHRWLERAWSLPSRVARSQRARTGRWSFAGPVRTRVPLWRPSSPRRESSEKIWS